MRKVLLAICAVVAIGLLTGASFLVSRIQAENTSALTELGFESVENESGLIGAPSKLKITDGTLDQIKKLKGKTITIDSEGRIIIDDK